MFTIRLHVIKKTIAREIMYACHVKQFVAVECDIEITEAGVLEDPLSSSLTSHNATNKRKNSVPNSHVLASGKL